MRALYYSILQLFYNVRFTVNHYRKCYGLPTFTVNTFESPGAVVWLCGFTFKGRAFRGFIVREMWDGSLSRMDRWKTCSLFFRES